MQIKGKPKSSKPAFEIITNEKKTSTPLTIDDFV